MRIKYMGFALVAFSLISLMAIPAMSETDKKSEWGAGKAACRADRDKLCPGLERGPDLKACMKKNKDLVSATCRDFKEARRKHHKRHGKNRACREDVQKFCSQHQGDRDAVKACLQQNRGQVSEGCQKKMAFKEARHEMRQACQTDREKFCGSVEPGKRAVRKCMREHQNQVSATCQQAMEKMKGLKPKRKGNYPNPQQKTAWESLQAPLVKSF